MKIFAQTPRLSLREILATDVDGMYELDSDTKVHKYLGNKPEKSKEETAEVINFIRQQYIDNGIGRRAIIDKKSNQFLRWTGLKFVTEETNNHTSNYDLGYRLIKRYWGKESPLSLHALHWNMHLINLRLKKFMQMPIVKIVVQTIF